MRSPQCSSIFLSYLKSVVVMMEIEQKMYVSLYEIAYSCLDMTTKETEIQAISIFLFNAFFLARKGQ